MRRAVYIGLGSNLGDRWQHLRDAVRALRELGPLQVSTVYESPPVGGPEGQGAYLNAVARLETDLPALMLLTHCQALEHVAGRVRRARWGARTLDLDLLLIDGERWSQPELTVPHPHMYERRFVLVPLAELAPGLISDAELNDAPPLPLREVGNL